MTYIIAEPCVDVKDLSCVDVCPVDCIHEASRILEAEALFNGFDLERFDEVEEDGQTALGEAKHWHLFHVVARRR